MDTLRRLFFRAKDRQACERERGVWTEDKESKRNTCYVTADDAKCDVNREKKSCEKLDQCEFSEIEATCLSKRSVADVKRLRESITPQTRPLLSLPNANQSLPAYLQSYFSVMSQNQRLPTELLKAPSQESRCESYNRVTGERTYPAAKPALSLPQGTVNTVMRLLAADDRDNSMKKRGLLVWHSTGSGKCHGLNTPIMLYSGEIRPVQDIVVGDLLMGDDSMPRHVLSLGHGEDELYEIVELHSDSRQPKPLKPLITCNSEHILCLRYKGPVSVFLTDDVIEMDVHAYLALPHPIRDEMRMYRNPVRFPTFQTHESEPTHSKRKHCNSIGHRLARLKELRQVPDADPLEIQYLERSLYYSEYQFKMRPVGRAPFYGFTLDGNGRYLLGDFTVTHNTCTAAGVVDAFWGKKKIVYVSSIEALNANPPEKFHRCALKFYPNFRYIGGNNQEKLKKIEKMWSTDDNVQFLTFAQLSHRLQLVRGHKDGHTSFLQNKVLIIDEVHNIFNPLPNQRRESESIRNFLLEQIDKPEMVGTKVVILSATPGNQPEQVLQLLNMIRDHRTAPFPIDGIDWASPRQLHDLGVKMAGLISYFDMSLDTSKFPTVKRVDHLAPMSEQQYEQYVQKVKEFDVAHPGRKDYATLVKADKVNDYYNTPRRWSNMLYDLPNPEGFEQFSAKLMELATVINQYPDEKHYIYSSFFTQRGFGGQGIYAIRKVLKMMGFAELRVEDVIERNDQLLNRPKVTAENQEAQEHQEHQEHQEQEDEEESNSDSQSYNDERSPPPESELIEDNEDESDSIEDDESESKSTTETQESPVTQTQNEQVQVQEQEQETDSLTQEDSSSESESEEESSVVQPSPKPKQKPDKKTCPEGEELNPRTNRCCKKCLDTEERIIEGWKCLKKCGPNQHRSPVNNRCVKDVAAKEKEEDKEKKVGSQQQKPKPDNSRDKSVAAAPMGHTAEKKHIPKAEKEVKTKPKTNTKTKPKAAIEIRTCIDTKVYMGGAPLPNHVRPGLEFVMASSKSLSPQDSNGRRMRDRRATPGENLQELRALFNNPKNDTVKIFLATQNYNESLDLKGVQHVHIFEPLLSQQQLQQTIGRAVRYCSHADLDTKKDWTVTVHSYISLLPYEVTATIRPTENVERKIQKTLSLIGSGTTELGILLGLSEGDILAMAHNSASIIQTEHALQHESQESEESEESEEGLEGQSGGNDAKELEREKRERVADLRQQLKDLVAKADAYEQPISAMLKRREALRVTLEDANSFEKTKQVIEQLDARLKNTMDPANRRQLSQPLAELKQKNLYITSQGGPAAIISQAKMLDQRLTQIQEVRGQLEENRETLSDAIVELDAIKIKNIVEVYNIDKKIIHETFERAQSLNALLKLMRNAAVDCPLLKEFHNQNVVSGRLTCTV